MTSSYVLLAEAEADLRAILRHTRKRWGDDQARTYAAKLHQCIERMAAGQSSKRDLGALYPGLLVTRCEHHFIFCLPREGASALIVAMFHERMDMMVRLADRLR